jgi:hypothetical protein
MRAQFYRVDDAETVLADVRYLDGPLEVGTDDDRTREAVTRIFHPSPVITDDPAFLPPGASGPAVVQPGSLQWFQAAARVRGQGEGLAVRFVPEAERAMGWDPAGAYRTFGDDLARRIRIGGPARTPEEEAGEARPEGERGPSAPGTEAAHPGPRPSAAGTSEASPYQGGSGGAEPPLR